MMIDFSNRQQLNITQTSSRGNQNKWKIGNCFYKMDQMGYEALAEVLTSRILQKSNITQYVQYDFVKIGLYGEAHTGCVCKDMKQEGEILIPLERFIRQEYNINLANKLSMIFDKREQISYTVNLLKQAGVIEPEKNLTILLELDAFTWNQDRHTNNISLIKSQNGYRFSNIYDNGDAFFSDLMYFPKRFTTEELIKRAIAKPFGGSFQIQKEAAEDLYGKQLQIFFTNDDLENVLKEANPYYSKDIIDRVRNLVQYQLKTYNREQQNIEKESDIKGRQ